MKKTSIYVTAFMTMFFLAACMNNDNAADDGGQNNQPRNVSYDQQGNDLDMNGTGDGLGGNNGTGGTNDGMGANNGAGGANGGTGGNNGTGGTNDGTGANNGAGGANGAAGNDGNADNGNNENDLSVNEEAASRVEELNEVDDSTVLIAGQRAYAAVNLENNQKLSDDLEKRIEKEVKEADQSIQTVYVSADPDFTSRMENYANRIDNGEPVEGFFDEFSDAVRRVFPNA